MSKLRSGRDAFRQLPVIFSSPFVCTFSTRNCDEIRIFRFTQIENFVLILDRKDTYDTNKTKVSS